MKLSKKLIAIPAIAIAAGTGLAANRKGCYVAPISADGHPELEGSSFEEAHL